MTRRSPMLIAELLAKVLRSGRAINRIYLCAAEYRQVFREAEFKGHQTMVDEVPKRISLGGATVYRLSEIGGQM